jgi:hypothetical protein
MNMEVIIILMLVFVVVSFGLLFLDSHKVMTGYIVCKEHHPMRAIQEYDSFLHRNVMRYLPERYFIYVADSKGVEKISVTEVEYGKLIEGQKWQRK